MSETKPPDELDELTMPLAWGGPYGASIEPEETRIENDKREKARAELAQLRAQAAAYQDAMRRLAMHQPNCAGTLPRSHAECDLCRFFKREIAAGRFQP